MRLSLICIALLAAALPLFAGDPSPIEERNFGLDSGWNRDGAAVAVSTFFLRDTSAVELTHEWPMRSPRHQVGYTIPVFGHGADSGLGDVALNYRYQLAGGSDSRVGVAPRLSLLLPTRAPHFGARSSGLEVSIPVSAALTPRLTTHTNVAATWFRDLGEHELTAMQGITFAATSRLELALDTSWKRTGAGESLVVRPAVQYAVDVAGLRLTPGAAFPLGDTVLLYVGVERPLR